jgi:DNA-binding transcriptional ArsR family regulator
MIIPPDTDAVFRALSDPSRRKILDLLKVEPGQSVGGLAEAFRFSRYAVMKHLRVLEQAQLVVSRRDGKRRLLFLNAIPIQTIYDRWISQYSAQWASRLTSIKYELEKEQGMPSAATQLKHVYVVYIRTGAEKLWEALTRPEMTKQYFHNTEIQGEFSVGSKVDYITTEEDGSRRPALTGEILECEPGRRLVHTFEFPRMEDDPTRVVYDIEPMGDVVKLTVTHEGFERETETYNMVQQGWPPILSGLKTLLETGQALGV